MNHNSIAIIGAGGHGREALDILRSTIADGADHDFAGFIDDNIRRGTKIPHTDQYVIGTIDDLVDSDLTCVVAIGDTHVRHAVLERIGLSRTVNLIHPSAYISPSVDHGLGLIAAQGAVVTNGTRLGVGVHLNVNTTISHDCAVGDYVTVTPGVSVSGSATIGTHVWLGVGSTVINNITIGNNVTLGAGATAVSDLPNGRSYVGTPAKPLPRR